AGGARGDGRGRSAPGQRGGGLWRGGLNCPTWGGGLPDGGGRWAGTPAELEQAVLDAVGLPYDQFTSCVVLPQGQFAEFLHARPAARQQILVNLLGLSVYERIRDQATAVAAQADAHLVATDRQLAELADASAEALDAAEQRVAAMHQLVTAVEAGVPALAQAEQDATVARTALADLDGELALLSRVSAPPDTTRIAQ